MPYVISYNNDVSTIQIKIFYKELAKLFALMSTILISEQPVYIKLNLVGGYL